MVHFAPVYNFGGKEIVAWSTPTSPSMSQQIALLDRLLERMPEGATPALHRASWVGSTSTPHGRRLRLMAMIFFFDY